MCLILSLCKLLNVGDIHIFIYFELNFVYVLDQANRLENALMACCVGLNFSKQVLYMTMPLPVLNSSPVDELGGGAYESRWWCQAKCEPRAGGAGIHGNPESGNHHQAPSH